MMEQENSEGLDLKTVGIILKRESERDCRKRAFLKMVVFIIPCREILTC
jgi:hypothetical protein